MSSEGYLVSGDEENKSAATDFLRRDNFAAPQRKLIDITLLRPDCKVGYNISTSDRFLLLLLLSNSI